MSVFAVVVAGVNKGEEPVEGFVLPGEGDGGEQGCAEPGVFCSQWCLMDFFQGDESFWGAGFRDGDGGFGGCVVFVLEELRGPGDSAGAFEMEDAGVTGSEELRFVAGEFGAEAEEEHCRVGADLFDGAGGVDADREHLVGEELGEKGEEMGAVEAAALYQRQGAGAAQRTGGVGASAPDGLELDVAHAGEEDFVLLIFEGGEGFGDGGFCPALGVSFDRVVAEAVEGCDKIRDQGGEVEI